MTQVLKRRASMDGLLHVHQDLPCSPSFMVVGGGGGGGGGGVAVILVEALNLA